MKHGFYVSGHASARDGAMKIPALLKKCESEETKCVLMSRSQRRGQKYSIKIANRSFEDVEKFKYLGTTLAGQNCMHEEIKSRLNSVTLATIPFRVFCPPTCCLGT
jgi:hypothetical protein